MQARGVERSRARATAAAAAVACLAAFAWAVFRFDLWNRFSHAGS
jgi:hypothetical protein